MLRGYRQGSDQAREVIDCLSDETAVREQLGEVDYDRVIFREMDTNDTWAQDHEISVFDEERPCFMISCSMAGNEVRRQS